MQTFAFHGNVDDIVFLTRENEGLAKSHFQWAESLDHFGKVSACRSYPHGLVGSPANPTSPAFTASASNDLNTVLWRWVNGPPPGVRDACWAISAHPDPAIDVAFPPLTEHDIKQVIDAADASHEIERIRTARVVQSCMAICDGVAFAAALAQVEHEVDHALAWAMIGVLATAPGVIDGEAIGRQQVLGRRGRSRRVERRMFQQPDQLRFGPGADGGDAGFHGRHRLVV